MSIDRKITSFIDKLRDKFLIFALPSSIISHIVNSIFPKIISGPNKGFRFSAPNGPIGYFWGRLCKDECRLFENELRAGDTFYDIGAHVGYLSLAASKFTGSSGTVIAIEPLPRNFKALDKNIERNDLPNILAFNLAVSDSAGEAVLISKADSTRSSISDNGIGLKIRTITLDELILKEGLPGPNFVKIDVEGAEIKVLLGMKDIIREFSPQILVEVHSLGKVFNDFIRKFCGISRYNFERIDGEPLTDTPERFLLFLKPK